MSHFSWLLATCFQERVFLSAEQLSLWCSPRTHGQDDGAGAAVRLVSPHLPLPPPRAISATPVPHTCHSGSEDDIPGKTGRCAGIWFVVLQADVGKGLLCIRPQLAVESLLHGEPAVRCGALLFQREEGRRSPRAVILGYQTAAAQSLPSPEQTAKAFRKSNQIIRQSSF